MRRIQVITRSCVAWADPNRLNNLGRAPIAGAVLFKREDEVVLILGLGNRT